MSKQTVWCSTSDYTFFQLRSDELEGRPHGELYFDTRREVLIATKRRISERVQTDIRCLMFLEREIANEPKGDD